MADRLLTGCRILVVEDEYLLANEATSELEDQGAIVLGPAPSIRHALALLDDGELPDAAVLDLNLGGEPGFPVADFLIERGVPVVFTTGYDAAALPERFAHVPRCKKPFDTGRIAMALFEAMRDR